ncbi:MAG TPA: pyrroline-5-carboxylate reductase [Polyangiaceae bacterium]|nr:pyrroline-5-carboxylate reductase [Polyangiaceae bacterium]
MTTLGKKLGILGGGNMASAIVRGLLVGGLVAPSELTVSDVLPARREALERDHGITTTADNGVVVRASDVVLIAVKPQVVPALLAEVGGALGPDKLLVSIAAGIGTGTLAAGVRGGTRIVRAMPNVGAAALAAATAIVQGPAATAGDLGLARRIFEAVGRVVEVEEKLIDAVTGLSGSGPAYVALFVEALADGGVRVGLPRDQALKLALQTVLGTAEVLVATGEHPARLRDQVTSPGGTTIAGLAELERGAVRHAVMAAVEAATRRAGELGRRTD